MFASPSTFGRSTSIASPSLGSTGRSHTSGGLGSSSEAPEKRLSLMRPVNGKIDISGLNLRTLEGLPPSAKVEALYVRNNGLQSMLGMPAFPQLRVLDCSTNLLTEIVIPRCPLRMLFLSANNISNVAVIPTIATLEVLSLSSNKIESLEGMLPQPELKVLSLSNNQLASFADLPVFPKLESFRADGNPISKVMEYRFAAVTACCPSLNRFDGDDVPADELRGSALVSFATRAGFVVQDRSTADVDAAQFLHAVAEGSIHPCQLQDLEISGESVEGATLTARVEILNKEGQPLHLQGKFFDSADHSEGVVQLQWKRGTAGGKFEDIDGATGITYTTTLSDVGTALMVAATVLIGDEQYGPAYAVTPDIQPSEPACISLTLEGKAIEGADMELHAVYCGGREGASIIRWFAKSEGQVVAQVAEGDRRVRLGLAHVNNSLFVEYIPIRSDGVAGAPATAECGVIQAARPSVTDVMIGGQCVEGAVVYGSGRYFGGAEGASNFQWFRGDGAAGPFVPIPGARAQNYTPTLHDVGRVVRFEYTPISTRGLVGTPAYAISSTVVAAVPKVSRLTIIGEPEELSTLTITADYFGGVEGPSELQWSRRPAEVVAPDRWAQIAGATSRTYNCTAEDINCFLRVSYRPIRNDGVIGHESVVSCETPVAACIPTVLDVTVDGSFIECEPLQAFAAYRGGVEGRSRIVWERLLDFDIAEHAGEGVEYIPVADDVDRKLRVTYTPVRGDGMEGKPSTCETQVIQPAFPRLDRLELTGSLMEGTDVVVDRTYVGGREGASRFRWMRVKQVDADHSVAEEVSHDITTQYPLTVADVGCQIVLEYVPVRSDGVASHGVIARSSSSVRPAEPVARNVSITDSCLEGVPLTLNYEYYGGHEGSSLITWERLQGASAEPIANGKTYCPGPKDIGCLLRATIIPQRNDRVEGTAVSSTLAVPIVAGEPEVKGFSLAKDATELVTIQPAGSYFGGFPGPQKTQWFRLKTGAAPELIAITRDYTPVLADVGCVLRFEWLPARADGKVGKAAVAETNPVAPGVPSLFTVPLGRRNSGIFLPGATQDAILLVTRLPNCDLYAAAEYRGGIEGASIYQWQRIGTENVAKDIPGANARIYSPIPTDTGFALLVKCTPVRNDGVVGATYTSAPTSPLAFNEIMAMKTITITGKQIEGETLNADLAGYDQKHVIQWFRGEDASHFTAIAGATSATYVPEVSDVDCKLKIEVTPIFGDVKGRPIAAISDKIQPGAPEFRNAALAFKNNIFTLSGRYFGGKEGQSKVTWMRASTLAGGDNEFKVIAGVTSLTYQITADDIDSVVAVEYVPVRADGVTGTPVFKESAPLATPADLAKELAARLASGEPTFRVKCFTNLTDGTPLTTAEDRGLLLNKQKVKMRVDGSIKTLVKEGYTGYSKAYVNPTNPCEVMLALAPGLHILMLAATPQERDLIVMIFREFEKGARSARLYKTASTFKTTASASSTIAKPWQQTAVGTGKKYIKPTSTPQGTPVATPKQ